VTLTPTVQAQAGQKIRIGDSPTNTALYDNFLYTVNATLILISDGTEWELS